MAVFDDCIAYWKCDEATGVTRADSVGSWDLADTSGDVSAYTGKINNGALSDGSGSLYASTSPPGALSGGAVSIAGWFRLDTNETGVIDVIDLQLSDSYAVKIQMSWTNNTCKWFVTDGVNTNASGLWGVSVTAWTVWNFLTITWTGTTVTTTANTGSATRTVTGSPAAPNLATSKTPVSLLYDIGSIAVDELGVWDSALSAADVSTLYNAGNGRTFGSSGAAVGAAFAGFHGFAK